MRFVQGKCLHRRSGKLGLTSQYICIYSCKFRGTSRPRGISKCQIGLLKGVSGEKEGGLKVCSIDCYRYGTMALEGEKNWAFAVVFYFILFCFRQEQHKTLQVCCRLCKCPAVWPLRTCLLHSSDFASVMGSTP